MEQMTLGEMTMTMNTTMVIKGMTMQATTIKAMTPRGTTTIRSTLVMVTTMQGNAAMTTTRSKLVMVMTMALTMLMMLAMTRTSPLNNITEAGCEPQPDPQQPDASQKPAKGTITLITTIRAMSIRSTTITTRSPLVMVMTTRGTTTTKGRMLVMLMTIGLAVLMMLAMTRTPPLNTITE